MAAQLIGAGVGAAGGLINHNQQLGQYNRDKQLAADIERNSSWTGQHGNMPKAPGSAFGSALQGGLGGAMFGGQFGGGGGAQPGANPMAGATPMGGDQSALTPMGQQMNPGAGQFAGSSWGSQFKPNTLNGSYVS